jgi:hypothetical protein
MSLITTLDELVAANSVPDSSAEHVRRSALPSVNVSCTFPPRVRQPHQSSKSATQVVSVSLSRLPVSERCLLFVMPGITPDNDPQFHRMFDCSLDLAQLESLAVQARKAAAAVAVLLPIDLLTASRLARSMKLEGVSILCDPNQSFARALQLPVFQCSAALIPRAFGTFADDVTNSIVLDADRLDDFGVACALPRRLALSICGGRVEKVWCPLAFDADEQTSTLAHVVQWAVDTDAAEQATAAAERAEIRSHVNVDDF